MRSPRRWFERRTDELSEEMDSHLAMAIAERVARGEPLAAATAAARRQFGNREMVRGTTREMWGLVWLEQLLLDFRYAGRQLRHAPGFAAVAALSLAIGTGATVTMYAVIDAADIRSLPYPHADRLYVIEGTSTYRTSPNGPDQTATGGVPVASTDNWQNSTHAFDAMARFGYSGLAWSHDDETESVDIATVGAGFFPLLGATPFIGRTIAPGDTNADAPGVLVLSYAFWRDRFGADRHVIGRNVEFDTSSAVSATSVMYTVIGVMPARVDYPAGFSGWVAERSGSHAFSRVLARLADGGSAAAATTELRAATARAPTRIGPGRVAGVRVTALRESLRSNGPSGMFTIDSAKGRLVRLGVVVFVLLIAMFNVGNLLLARSAARDHEMAVRRALGASRARLAQQLLVEGGCLAVIGGTLGVALARWGVATSISFGTLASRGIVPVLDARVLVFALALTMIVALGTGFIPVLSLTRAAGASARSESPQTPAGLTRVRVQNALLVVQVGAALTLLTGAGVLGKELWRLERQGFGFDATNLAFFSGVHRPFGTTAMDGAQFRENALRSLRRVPGVASVSVIEMYGNDGFYPLGEPEKAGHTVLDHQDVSVNPGFLKNLGIPLIRGRDLNEADYAGATQVALVSTSAAQAFWPGEDPLGKQVIVPPPMRSKRDTTTGDTLTVTVVGVIGDARFGRISGPPPTTLMRPTSAMAGRFAEYFVRATKDLDATMPALRHELHALEGAPLDRMMYGSLQKNGIDRQLAEQRVTTRALIVFAAVALLLATLGIHGLVSYSVAQRTREIGIRMALGAASAGVLLLVTRRGLMLAAWGIVIGLAGSFGLTQLLRAMLYGTSPTDPIVFVGAATILATVVFVASYLPARRATRVDPMVALRVD
ncbi:MAG: ADOP family duplicated permease [Gemmatimonadales bacterium]